MKQTSFQLSLLIFVLSVITYALIKISEALHAAL